MKCGDDFLILLWIKLKCQGYMAKYYAKCRKGKAGEELEGWFIASYVVTKEGRCADFRYLSEPGPKCSEKELAKLNQFAEAQIISEWLPAQFNGKPVTVRVVVECYFGEEDTCGWSYYLLEE